MILAPENWFLIGLGIVWIVGAILQDFHRREVDNIWNFSLIAFALAYRAGVSVFTWDYWFFINGLIGFGIFLILGNIFYYSRVFAGGDAKLLIALGAILPLSYDWIVNLKIFGLFCLGFLIGGSVYVLVWSLFLVGFNFKKFSKEFVKQVKFNKFIFLISLLFFVFCLVFVFFVGNEFVLTSLIFLLFPVLYIYVKAVEESCMIKGVIPDRLTEGDWLVEDIYVGGKKVKANWEGVSRKDLKLIQAKYRRKILVKYGVPFTPAFLIGLLVLIFLELKFSFF